MAASATPATIRMLREILRQQRQFRHGHNAEFLAFVEQFHRALALSAGRAYAWRTIKNIKAQRDRTRYLSLDDATPIHLLIKRTSGLSMRSNRAIRTRHPPLSARTCSKSCHRCQKLPGNFRICLNRAEQPDGLDSASPEKRPEPLVNRAFGGRLPGDPLSTRVSERVGWKCPIRAGFRAPALPALFVGGACDQVGGAAGCGCASGSLSLPASLSLPERALAARRSSIVAPLFSAFCAASIAVSWR